MPPKPFLFDLQSRNSFICRSCLAAFRTKPPQQPFLRLYAKSALRQPSQPTGTRPQATSAAVLDEERPPTVHYFEQQDDGNLQPLSGNDSFSKQFNTFDADLEARLKELEEKLQDAAGLRKILQKHGLQDKVNRLEKQYELEEEDAEDDQVALPPVRDSGLRSTQRRHIARLNSCLRNASRSVRKGIPNKKIISNTWKHYSLARPGLSMSWDNIPTEAWDALWEIFSWENEANPNRMAHVCALAKDMTAAGVQLSDARQLLAIEAMFIEGWRKEAIDNWKRVVVTVGSKPEFFQQYWELGIRMCSVHGDLERAERAADTLLESPGTADARVLIHLIRAYAATPENAKTAWRFYRLLRERLGDSMQIEDYDEVISCFLATSQMEFALHAFVDMMFSGAIDLQGRTKLPSSVSNHFFLGKWLKRLIGAGDLDGAHGVLKFMQSKGIMAAAVQVNGLIGAWLRSGAADNLKKADDLAWAMIRSRLTFVQLRRREAALEWPLKLRESGGHKNLDDKSDLTFVPKATLETFSLMAENYRSRGLHSRLEELWVAFKESEITTDAFMMNQLIESHAEEARGEEARELYRMMTQEHHILPNSHTFFALFKTLAVNRVWWPSLTEDLKEQDRIACRQIFRDLLRSSWVFDDDDGGMHEIQAKMVLHSFRKSGDYIGFLVALQALRQILHFPISQIVVLEMIAESDDLHRPTPRAKEQILKARRTIEYIVADRRRAAPEGSESPSTVEEKVDELYAVVAQYYRAKIDASDEQVQELYHIVAREMGVYDSLVEKRSAIRSRGR